MTGKTSYMQTTTVSIMNTVYLQHEKRGFMKLYLDPSNWDSVIPSKGWSPQIISTVNENEVVNYTQKILGLNYK